MRDNDSGRYGRPHFPQTAGIGACFSVLLKLQKLYAYLHTGNDWHDGFTKWHIVKKIHMEDSKEEHIFLKLTDCLCTNKFGIIFSELNLLQKEEQGRMRKISWKKRLMLSYLFVALIPLLILGAFFYYSNRVTMRRELEQNNQAMLIQVMQKIDYMMGTMTNAAYHFSNTDMAGQLDDMRNKAVAIDEGLILAQMQTYGEMVGNESEKVSPFLYLRGDRYIYTESGRMAYMTFQESMVPYGDLNLIAFFQRINSEKRSVSVLLHDDEEKKEGIVFFLYPIPYMNQIPIATLGFGLDEKAMEHIFRTYYSMDSTIYLFNSRYQNIYTLRSADEKAEDRAQMDSRALSLFQTGGAIEREWFNGHNYIVTKAISADTGFFLVAVTDQKVFYRYDDPILSGLLCLIALLFFLGLLLAVLLSERNFQPVQKLLNRVSGGEEGTTDEVTDTGNEFEFISGKWDDIQNRNQELNALVNRQRPMVMAACLRRLLKGSFSSREELEMMLKSAAVNLGYRYSFAILIPLPADMQFEQEESIRILSILSKEIHPHSHIYGLDILKDDGFAIIVNCQEKEVGGVKDIRTVVAGQLFSRLKEEQGLELPFCVGRVYEDLMEISRSFMEATAVASNFMMLGREKIHLFEEMEKQEANIQYPVLEQAVYIQCLKQANEEEAIKALDNMLTEIEKSQSFLFMQCLCFDIINVTVKTMDQMKGFELNGMDMKEVCTFANLEEFRKKMTHLVQEICVQYRNFKTSSQNQLKLEILNYVNQHFTENQMGLESVAEAFDISANYLSRFFKQETGCSFVQYVTMLRMDRARELLVNSEMQVKEIVAEIGYIDVASFVRKFKSIEGITPGQYREQRRRKDD